MRTKQLLQTNGFGGNGGGRRGVRSFSQTACKYVPRTIESVCRAAPVAKAQKSKSHKCRHRRYRLHKPGARTFLVLRAVYNELAAKLNVVLRRNAHHKIVRLIPIENLQAKVGRLRACVSGVNLPLEQEERPFGACLGLERVTARSRTHSPFSKLYKTANDATPSIWEMHGSKRRSTRVFSWSRSSRSMLGPRSVGRRGTRPLGDGRCWHRPTRSSTPPHPTTASWPVRHKDPAARFPGSIVSVPGKRDACTR